VALDLAVWLLSFAVPQPPDEVARELTDIVRQLAVSWKNGDCEAWSKVIAAEWSVTHINGDVITRAQAIEMCRAQATPIASLSSDDISVRAFGDTAVVTGRTTATTGGAQPETVRLRFTDVFIRRDGRWQAVASHATRLP
jgi:ketosteroid isomerase-like protein